MGSCCSLQFNTVLEEREGEAGITREAELCVQPKTVRGQVHSNHLRNTLDSVRLSLTGDKGLTAATMLGHFPWMGPLPLLVHEIDLMPLNIRLSEHVLNSGRVSDTGQMC